jgi:hypothetical protein
VKKTNKGEDNNNNKTNGTKDNLATIIDNLSYIIGRKGWPKEEPRKAINNAFKNTDAYIAAIALIKPEIDSLWRETNARENFLKIKKRRLWLRRLLYGSAMVGTLITIAGTIIALIFIDHWAKWLLLAVVVLFLTLGSMNIPIYLIEPQLIQWDYAIPHKFPEECKTIDTYIKKLLLIRRAM